MATRITGCKGQGNLLAFLVLAIVLGGIYLVWMAMAPVASEKLPDMYGKLQFSNSKLQNVSSRGMTNATGVFTNLPYGILLIVAFIVIYAVFTPTGGYQ